MPGLFVTLEGGEGAGKSALAAALGERVQAAGGALVATFEPGGTPLGATIREQLLDPDRSLLPWTETFLFMADRSEHVARVIRPALGRGAVVICDRFSDSTLAYQGYGRSLDPALLAALNRHACDGLEPDLTLLLDLPARVGLERARAQQSDRIGAETVEFHARVVAGFQRLAAAAPGRIHSIDATRPFEDVLQAAWALVQPRLPPQA